MSQYIEIPSCSSPFVVQVNGETYSYPAGETVEVPDHVAAAITHHMDMQPKANQMTGGDGSGGSCVVAKFEMREDEVSLVCRTHTSDELHELVLNGIPVICLVYLFGTQIVESCFLVPRNNDETFVGDHRADSGYAHVPFLEDHYVDGDTSNKTIGNEIWYEV